MPRRPGAQMIVNLFIYVSGRGIFQREYAGATLRENLGLPRAERGDWRSA